MRDELGPCERCGNIAEIREGHAECDVCLDSKRDAKVLCVVARVHDLLAIERAGSMRGRYFVLGRLLSPLEGIGPEDLPGYKAPRVVCAECGEGVNFKREVVRDGRTLCRACAGERYYDPL